MAKCIINNDKIKKTLCISKKIYKRFTRAVFNKHEKLYAVLGDELGEALELWLEKNKEFDGV